MEWNKNKAGFKPNNQYGVRFSKNYQPKRNGRKKSTYKQIEAGIGGNSEIFSKEDFLKVLQILMSLTPLEVKKLVGKNKDGVSDSEFPVWVVNIGTALLSDIRYGRIKTITILFDMLFGKPGVEVVNFNQINIQNNINLSLLTSDELKNFNYLLDKVSSLENKFLPDYLTD